MARTRFLHAAMAVLVMAAAAAAQGEPPAVQPTDGCVSILESATYYLFYNKTDTASYDAFRTAVCSLPLGESDALALPFDAVAQASFNLSASVLMKPGRWIPATDLQLSASSSTADAFRATLAYGVVRDYYSAVCRGLPVASLRNINTDSIQRYSTLLPSLVTHYSNCLILAEAGLTYQRTSPLGSPRLTFTLMYTPDNTNPGTTTISALIMTPMTNGQTAGGSCTLLAPGSTTPQAMPTGSMNVMLISSAVYTITCDVLPGRLYDGMATNILFRSLLDTASKLDYSFYTLLFHGVPLPPLPPSPSPSPPPPSPPPSPSPPRPPSPPPPSCEAQLLMQAPQCNGFLQSVSALQSQVEALTARVRALEQAETPSIRNMLYAPAQTTYTVSSTERFVAVWETTVNFNKTTYAIISVSGLMYTYADSAVYMAGVIVDGHAYLANNNATWSNPSADWDLLRNSWDTFALYQTNSSAWGMGLTGMYVSADGSQDSAFSHTAHIKLAAGRHKIGLGCTFKDLTDSPTNPLYIENSAFSATFITVP